MEQTAYEEKNDLNSMMDYPAFTGSDMHVLILNTKYNKG